MMRWNMAGLIVTVVFLTVVITLRNHGIGNGFFDVFRVIPYYDKVGHFFLMGVLSYFAVKIAPPHFFRHTVLGMLIIVGLEEAWQSVSPLRTCSLMDYGASVLGILIFARWARRPYAFRGAEWQGPESPC